MSDDKATTDTEGHLQAPSNKRSNKRSADPRNKRDASDADDTQGHMEAPSNKRGAAPSNKRGQEPSNKR